MLIELAYDLPLPVSVAERDGQPVLPDFRAFIALAAFAGLRLGEIAGLQVGDIDFLRRTLAVTRQVQRGNGDTSVSSHRSTAASAPSTYRTTS